MYIFWSNRRLSLLIHRAFLMKLLWPYWAINLQKFKFLLNAFSHPLKRSQVLHQYKLKEIALPYIWLWWVRMVLLGWGGEGTFFIRNLMNIRISISKNRLCIYNTKKIVITTSAYLIDSASVRPSACTLITCQGDRGMGISEGNMIYWTIFICY